MAVHNLGYRAWTGELAPAWSRFVVITTTGVRRAWSSRWLRRMMMFAWTPALGLGIAFFVFENFVGDAPSSEIGARALAASPLGPMMQGVNTGDMSELRHDAWARLLLVYLQYPQGSLMVMMLGIIAPPLISQDVRSRAFLLYFSRPINRWEYILGKAATIWAYLTSISLAPALLVYVVGVLMSSSLGVVTSTWDLPFRVVVASAFLMIPTAALALCFSSMTQESRVAGFAWFAVWILGYFAFGAIGAAEMTYTQSQMALQNGNDPYAIQFSESVPISNWTYLSLYHTLGVAQSWVFGFETLTRALPAIIILTLISAGSMAVLYRRVSAPMRA